MARGLRRCFGQRAGIVTGIVNNEVGLLLEDLILQGGVDPRFIRWAPFDGIGRTARNGLNFTERGFGMRAAKGCSDRAHTAVSQLKVGDIDWDHIFGTCGTRWFHTGGIFCRPLQTQRQNSLLKHAKKRRSTTSESLTISTTAPAYGMPSGGKAKAQEVNQAIAPYVDVMIGNEEDFTACLGFEVEGVDTDNVTGLEVDHFRQMISRVVET